MDSLRYFIHELKPDVMVITETWLKTEDKIEISGYNSIRKDRENKAGGGIIIFTKKNTVQEVIVKQPNEKEENEILWINGKIRGKTINLCAVYGLQSNTNAKELNNFYDSIDREIGRALSRRENIVLTGDFNAKVGSAVKGNKEEIGRPGRMLLRLAEKWDLRILNGEEHCEGTWTRINTNNDDEKSVINYIICDKNLNKNVSSTIIDDKKLYVLTKFD